MNGILGMAQLLQLEGKMDESVRKEHAQIIFESGKTLMALLNDILDLSKLETGKMDLTPSPFNPEKLIEETCRLFNPMALEKSLSLSCGWLGPSGQTCYADSIRLRQMLFNLISNAIKFTERGQISVLASLVQDDPSRTMMEFSVKDTGIGIPAHLQGKLFQTFSQVDSSSTRKYGGSGLGLSIVSNLATLMGGTVGVESAPGAGSRFWFRVRAELTPPNYD
jgi:signal transduction histidine kinase